MQYIYAIFSPLLIICDWIGKIALQQIYFLSELVEMAYFSFKSALFSRRHGERAIIREILEQTYFTGFQALPIITALAVVVGAATILQASEQLNFIGSRAGIGDVLVIVVLRELAPLLTGLILIARSGTAVAAHLGMMKASGEIEALESMGINPYSYLIFPRLIGGVASVVSLTFYFCIAAFAGGYILTTFVNGLDLGFYLQVIFSAIDEEDFVLFLVKTIFNGFFIFLICGYYGLEVRYSTHEVPAQTTKAVMRSLSYVIFFNLEASLVFYLVKFAWYGWI